MGPLVMSGREREAEIGALRRRLEAAEQTQDALRQRVRQAEGLAAAVCAAVARLDEYLQTQSALPQWQAGQDGRQGLAAALRWLRAHLGPVLQDPGARCASA